MVAAEEAEERASPEGRDMKVRTEDKEEGSVRQEVYVDRARLENMMSGRDENMEPAEIFFKRIMLETNTRIMWPTQLKIGGKTRRMPRVHFSGEMENVMQAVRHVRRVLAAPDERVTLKLDISHAFHSHIIGRGGAQVQSLMRETGAHVHFPDCNRSAGPDSPRSNFVSATGPLPAVEKARAMLREMMPVVFYMDVNLCSGALEARSALAAAAPPAGTVVATVLSSAAASCQAALAAALTMTGALQKTFGVSVRARMRCVGAGIAQLQIRGTDNDIPRLRTVCAIMARELCNERGPEGSTEVYSIVQISPRHQSMVLGPNNQFMIRIAENTGAQLSVPDVNDESVPFIRRGAITVAGAIDAVYLARQQIIGSLPLKLVFDIPEQMAVQTSAIMQLSNMLDVSITTFRKEKQHCTTITIRGIERNASNLYEARRLMLGSHISPVLASIPVTYHIPMKVASHSYDGRVSSTGNSPVAFRALDMFQNCPSTSTSDDSSPSVSPLKNGSPHSLNNSASSSPMVSPVKIPPRLALSSNANTNVSPMRAAPRLAMAAHGNHASCQGATCQLMNSSRNTLQQHHAEHFNNAPSSSQMFPVAPRGTLPSAMHSSNVPPSSAPDSKENCMNLQTLPNATPPRNASFQYPVNQDQNGVNLHGVEPILQYLGLGKYIGLFQNEEIDFEVFQSLNEQDLLNIGITAYGARRKLMGVINSLKKNEVPYSGSAAPGAERKQSPPDNGKRSW